MGTNLVYWCVFVVLAAIIWLCNKYFNLLKDVSDAAVKPYSYSRVQLAFWTLIILSSFISIYIITGQIPVLADSTLILLGISAGTTTAASMIDASDQAKNIALSQDDPGKSFFLDILSDGNGISIHRLQTVLFNLIFGAWFIQNYLHNMSDYIHTNPVTVALPCKDCMSQLINKIIPDICTNNLILMGVSSGTYAALKTTENGSGMSSGNNQKPPVSTPPATPHATPSAPPPATGEGGAA